MLNEFVRFYRWLKYQRPETLPFEFTCLLRQYNNDIVKVLNLMSTYDRDNLWYLYKLDTPNDSDLIIGSLTETIMKKWNEDEPSFDYRDIYEVLMFLLPDHEFGRINNLPLAMRQCDWYLSKFDEHNRTKIFVKPHSEQSKIAMDIFDLIRTN